MLIGENAIEILQNSHIAVFGIGGVGSFVIEALSRAGVGELTIIDNDTVSITNINRQSIAFQSTAGKKKTDVMSEKLLDINPKIKVNKIDSFFCKENAGDFEFSNINYIIDAIDTITSKILLVEKAKEFSIPIISCMGTGNKLNATMFEIDDIYRTSECPLARIMRNELRKREIYSLKVLYSKEKAKNTGSRTPASISFVPSVAGLLIAGEVVRELIGEK